MSNQHERSASRPWLAKRVWMLPTALVVALVAMFTLSATSVFAQEPIIQIDKGADVEAIRGSSVTFNITVNNNTELAAPAGNPPARDLTGVQVIDNGCSNGPTLARTGGDNGDNILQAGETWTYSCVVNNVQQDINNFAEVRATDAGNPVSDSDAARITVIEPGLNVTKAAVTSPIVQGANATFNITVRNTGLADIPEANITLSDVLCTPAIDPKLPTAGDTQPGPSGAPDVLDGDPDGNLTNGIGGETWSYVCTVPAPPDDVVNTVTVTAKDSNNQTWTRSATATVVVLNPGLNVTKTPNKSVVTVNEAVTWKIQVYNTGEVSYTGFSVVSADDPNCAAAGGTFTGPSKTIADPDADLEPGEMWEYICSVPGGYPLSSPNLPNTVTVNGTRSTGGTDTSSATATVDVVAPGLQATKKPFVQHILQGQAANFTIEVINTGTQGALSALSNVAVSDPQCTTTPTYVSGDANNNGKLDADLVDPVIPPYLGETWIFACSRTSVQSSFTNVATASGKDSANNTVTSAPTTAAVFVFTRNINIVKTVADTYTPPAVPPGDTTVLKGETVVFNLRVTTNGNVELTNVTVTDPGCDANTLTGPVISGANDNDGRLDPGEIWDYTCTKANVTADFNNTASATAKDPQGNPLSDDDTLAVDVLTPGLLLEKTPAYQEVDAGKEIIWTLRIHNTGQANLNPTGVGFDGLYDPMCGNLTHEADNPGDGDLTLEPGEVWVFTCSLPYWYYWGLNNVQNIAQAVFIDDNNNTVSDIESAIAQIRSPIIDLEKTANATTVFKGSNVEFTFEVRNTSGQSYYGVTQPQDLTNVDVSDGMCPGGKPTVVSGDTNGDNKLNPVEVWIYKCTVTNVAAGTLTNSATVTAKNAVGLQVSDSDTVSVNVLNVGLNVTKSTNTPIVQQGANVLFTIQASNTGTQNLTTVSISDNMTCQGGPGGAPTFGSGDVNANTVLDVGEIWTWTCTVANAQQDYTNSATVTAKEQSTGQAVTPQTGTANVTVLRPGINLQKTPPTQSVLSGQAANFQLLVSNTGNSALTNVQITDALCSVQPPPRISGDTNNNNTLDAGEVWTYSCTVNNVTQNLTNSAAVTASSGNQSVADTDTASVTVLTPGIRIDKTPDQQTVAAGGTANFTINVSNPGTAPLSSVVVTDPLCSAAPLVRTSGDTDNDNVLDPGETWVYTCSIANVTQNLVNTASVNASTGAGTVNASDTANVTVQTTPPPSGSLVLAQTVNPATIVKGGSATFQATLANGTATNMTGISLKGDKCKNFTRQADAPGNNDAVLNSGETWVWQCVLTKVTKTTTNKVTAKIKAPKQTLTASIKLTVTSGRDLLIEEDSNEVSGVEVLIDGEGKVIDEAQLLNKNYLPIVIGEEE